MAQIELLEQQSFEAKECFKEHCEKNKCERKKSFKKASLWESSNKSWNTHDWNYDKPYEWRLVTLTRKTFVKNNLF